MKNLALFDLDHTLLPIDSDHEWGEFLARVGAVDGDAYRARNDAFFAQYKPASLDPVEYLEFALGTLAAFPRAELDALYARYMREVIEPAIKPQAAAAGARSPGRRRPGGDHHRHQPLHHGADRGSLRRRAPHRRDARIRRGRHAHRRAWPARRRRAPARSFTCTPGSNACGQPFDSFGRSYFYSDSHNDIPLLSIVSHPVATNPGKALASHAREQGWPTIQLFND